MDEWLPFGMIYSFDLPYVVFVSCLFVILFPFGFEGGTMVLIAPVPDHSMQNMLVYIFQERMARRMVASENFLETVRREQILRYTQEDLIGMLFTPDRRQLETLVQLLISDEIRVRQRSRL